MLARPLAIAMGALICLGALVCPAWTSGASAQYRERDWSEWVELGCQRVSFRVDHDVVHVGRREGRFKAVRMVARGGDIEVLDLRVVYGSGEPDDVRVSRVLRRGDRSPPLDLRGWERAIDRVELVYRALPSYRGRDAEVCVEGLTDPRRDVAPPPPPHPEPRPGRGDWDDRPSSRDWEELGCQPVSLYGRDRDSIRVGRHEGRFHAIRLAVHGGDVELLDLTVIYANGEPDSIPVRRYLRRGERSLPLDLRGWERAIERVDLLYRAGRSRGTATVCVEGRP